MLGWTRRGLQAGEARLARWSPLQAARPTGQPMTPDTTRPVGRSGRDWRPQPAGSICSSRVNPRVAVGNNRHRVYAPYVCFRLTER